jgi:hypothetical protein
MWYCFSGPSWYQVYGLQENSFARPQSAGYFGFQKELRWIIVFARLASMRYQPPG